MQIFRIEDPLDNFSLALTLKSSSIGVFLCLFLAILPVALEGLLQLLIVVLLLLLFALNSLAFFLPGVAQNPRGGLTSHASSLHSSFLFVHFALFDHGVPHLGFLLHLLADRIFFLGFLV